MTRKGSFTEQSIFQRIIEISIFRMEAVKSQIYFYTQKTLKFKPPQATLIPTYSLDKILINSLHNIHSNLTNKLFLLSEIKNIENESKSREKKLENY